VTGSAVGSGTGLPRPWHQAACEREPGGGAGAGAVIPDFIDVGQPDRLLPKGVHDATPDEVRMRLVDAFPGSTSRPGIFSGWSAYSASLRALIDVQSEFLDGSFVTSRQEPDDVDMSLWIRALDLDALNPIEEANLNRMLAMQRSFQCDVYLVPECVQNHPLRPHFDQQRDWTKKYWRAYKDPNDVVIPGIAKGYLRVTP
jgi:hypothetical protein